LSQPVQVGFGKGVFSAGLDHDEKSVLSVQGMLAVS